MSDFIKNVTIRDAATGFFYNDDFRGLRFLVGNTTATSIVIFQEEEPQNSIKLDLGTIILKDINGVDVTPATTEEKAALLAVYVSKRYTNGELFTNGSKVGDTNPLPSADVDQNNRDALNTVFGDRITGIRKASIAAQFQYGIQDGTSEEEIVSSGSTSIDASMLVMSTGIAVDGRARIQSVQTIRYIPGQETYCVFTLVFSPAVVNSRQYGGLFDDEDGFFVGYDTDGSFNFFRRRDGVDYKQEIDIAAFNKEHNYTYDPTKGNIYRISFGYLGFAPISLELMRPNGGWVLLSKIQYPNSQNVTHILQTFLPVRGEVENTGNNSDIVLKSGSLAAGITNGGDIDVTGRTFSWETQAPVIVSGNTTVVVFRNKANFFGKVNRVPARLILISGDNEMNKNARWKLYEDPTLEAAPVPIWADVDAGNSTLEYSDNAIVDYAASIDTFLTWNKFKTSDFFENVKEFALDLMPGQIAAFVIETDAAATGEADLSIRWTELF
jgi:hypothetical protein